ncbi:MAG: hypothetical protein JXQ75_10850 [Phycisphaerae bacterium]|nr:hypothetical protein [Phycisphaerae bacterium]
MEDRATVPSGSRSDDSVATGPSGELRLGSRQRREQVFAVLLCLAGLSVSAVFACISPEGIVQFDDLTHYLYAKWAWLWPAYLLDDWGRPGFTALYFLPARLGWTACRLLSAILTAASAWFAFRIAKKMGLRRAWAVVPLCYAQPLFFQLSQTTLTETAMAFYLTLAVYLAQKRRWSLSAAILSVGFTTRHEAIIFLPVWIWFAWRRNAPMPSWSPNGKPTAGRQTASQPRAAKRQASRGLPSGKLWRGIVTQIAGLWRLWPLLWAPLVVNALAPIVGLKPAVLRLLEPAPSGQYGHGGWLTFFSRALEAWGPGVTVLAMTGIGIVWRKTRGGALAAACVAVYFCTHTTVRALGLYDSGGYARFLVPISPLVAIAALAGWQRLWAAEVRPQRAAVMLAAGSMLLLWIAMERQLVLHAANLDEAAHLPRLHEATTSVRLATATVVVLAVVAVAGASARRVARYTKVLMPTALAVMILLASYALCHPLWKCPEAYITEDLERWLANNGLGDREVISANVWVDYVTGQELPPYRPSVRRRLEQAPIGSLFVWDRQFAASAGHALALAEFQDSEAFRRIRITRPVPFEHEPYLTVFEKTRPWGPTTEDSSNLTTPEQRTNDDVNSVAGTGPSG